MKKTMLIIFALLMALLSGCGCVTPPSESPAPSPSPTPTPAPTEYRGIDVSFYQGDIDFSEVKDAGIEAVYIRAGEGTEITDSQFEANYEKASSVSLPLGFYYFVTADNAQQAQAQAQRFAGLIDGKSYQLRPAMDFEDFSGLSTAELNEIALAFLQELEAQTSVLPAFYTDAYAAESIWSSALSRYPLWIADYGPGEADPPATGVWPTWAGYQYADNGSVSGISTAVDLDVFRDTLLITG